VAEKTLEEAKCFFRSLLWWGAYTFGTGRVPS